MIFVVRRATLDFAAPARLDDLLEVTVEPLKLAHVYLQLVQEAKRGMRVLARAQIKVACLDLRSFKPVAIPQFLRDNL